MATLMISSRRPGRAETNLSRPRLNSTPACFSTGSLLTLAHVSLRPPTERSTSTLLAECSAKACLGPPEAQRPPWHQHTQPDSTWERHQGTQARHASPQEQ
eukprot:188634-Amphidinium_carterae.1